MKISLDDGVTFVECKGVRVLYEGIDVHGETCAAELHVNLTPEGIVMDVWTELPTGGDSNPGTSSETAQEIAERLCNENS